MILSIQRYELNLLLSVPCSTIFFPLVLFLLFFIFSDMFLGLMPFHCWSWYLSPIYARIDICHQFMFTLWCKEIITRECSELSGSKWGGLPIDQWFGSGLPQLCQLSPLDPSSSVFTFRGDFQEYFLFFTNSHSIENFLIFSTLPPLHGLDIFVNIFFSKGLLKTTYTFPL